MDPASAERQVIDCFPAMEGTDQMDFCMAKMADDRQRRPDPEGLGLSSRIRQGRPRPGSPKGPELRPGLAGCRGPARQRDSGQHHPAQRPVSGGSRDPAGPAEGAHRCPEQGRPERRGVQRRGRREGLARREPGSPGGRDEAPARASPGQMAERGGREARRPAGTAECREGSSEGAEGGSRACVVRPEGPVCILAGRPRVWQARSRLRGPHG